MTIICMIKFYLYFFNNDKYLIILLQAGKNFRAILTRITVHALKTHFKLDLWFHGIS